MQALVTLENVSFTYRQRSRPTISDINLQVAAGDFLLLTGATGCGKSTLLKTLNGLLPHESGGLLTGRVIIDGRDSRSCSIASLSRHVGMVFQSPDDQIFSTTVFDETAFVLENSGVTGVGLKARVDEALAMVGLLDKRDASVHALSGGQKQRLAVASVLAARPKVLALDEPISQLDPQGAAELLAVLRQINATLGITVIIVEHRLHEVMPLCQRVVVMDAGRIVWQGSQEEAFARAELFAAHGLRLPQPVTICARLGIRLASAQVEAAAAAIRERYTVTACEALPPPENACGEPALTVDGVCFRYQEKGELILNMIRLTLAKGQFIALMGSNGAGKSTLLHVIGGLLQPAAGQVLLGGDRVGGITPRIGMVLQNPDFMLFNSSVRQEIGFACSQAAGRTVWTETCEAVSVHLGLQPLADDFPLALSRGQRLRVAIAAVLASQPEVLLLDEPTTGQDIGHIEDIAALLGDFTAQGGTIIFCTHDGEVAARYADRVIVMRQGRIAADAPPAEGFSRPALLLAAGLKPPAALQLAQRLYGGQSLTAEEVIDYVRQNSLGSDAGLNPAT